MCRQVLTRSREWWANGVKNGGQNGVQNGARMECIYEKRIITHF